MEQPVPFQLAPDMLPHDILRCPRCRSPLKQEGSERWLCTDTGCHYSRDGFATLLGQPVLIDFEHSIFTPEDVEQQSRSVLAGGMRGTFLGSLLMKLTYGGDSPVTLGSTRTMVEHLKRGSPRPRVLVVGGGTLGAGASPLYDTPETEVIGTDVYASPHTALVCDGHALPFADAAFDGVFIQAVLEHVLEPKVVVDEIHRVLKPGGLVWAGTPFMQQVHMGAYDFTRFTHSGHRWLFRRFDEIESGVVGGPGMTLLWSIAYLFRALGLGPRAVALATAPFFWVRYLGRRAGKGPSADSASGLYSLGTKSAASMRPRDIVAYFDANRA